MADTRIVSGGQNETPITALHVRPLARANAIPVFLVNTSGDLYNALAAGGSTTNLTGINGVVPSVNAGTSDTGTLRVVVASDQAAIPISFTTPVTGVQILGGAVGGTIGISGDSPFTIGKITAPVGISGDVLVRGGNAVAVKVDGSAVTQPVSFSGGVSTIPPVTGVQIVGGGGGSVSPSGDFPVRLAVATAPIGISGDVSTLPKAGQTWPVSIAASVPVTFSGQVGVNIVGGSVGGKFSSSGDTLNVSQQGIVGVYVVGGSGQPAAGISGDVAVKPSATTGIGRFPVSGDTGISDGVTRTTLATVKAFTRSNPLTVALVNASGDVYNAAIDQPVAIALAGRVTSAGSNTIVAAVAGKKIKVFSYSLQGDGNNSRGFFASGASGTQLSLEWELAAREGVVKQIGAETSQCLFATTAGALLSFEMSSTQAMKYEISYHAEDSI